MIIETNRLALRELELGDFEAVCGYLQDSRVMYAYEHAFSDDEALEWLKRQIKRYEDYGFGAWAVILKETGELIGQCGLTMQDVKGQQELEIGYLLCKRHWHMGYATEAAEACRDYAFNTLCRDEVCSIIRDTNIASQNVAKRVGMTLCDSFVKHYYGVDMPHWVYRIKNPNPQ